MDTHTKVGNLKLFGMTSSTTSCTVASVFLIVAAHKKDQKGTNEVHTVGMPANDEGYRIQGQICTAIIIHLDEGCDLLAGSCFMIVSVHPHLERSIYIYYSTNIKQYQK
jgi:hypothetical protein